MSCDPSAAPPVPRGNPSFKKSGRTLLAVLAAAAGVLLLLFGSKLGKSADTGNSGAAAPSDASAPGGAYEMSIDDYRTALETHIAAACRQVRGVGDVTVVVSLGGGFEYVYATDTKTSAAGTGTSYVMTGSGASSKPVFLTERTPPVTGIGVICEGGADPAVRQELTSLLSAAYGIGTNRIYVTARKGG